MNKDNKLFNVFYNTIEALEEYVEKIGYPGFKKQIFDKSINSLDRSSEDLADDFLCQLYYAIHINYLLFKETKLHTGIKADNCPKNLQHYLFTINEVLEDEGENFVQQTDEKNNSGKKSDPKDVQELFNKYQQELNNPSEKKEIDIQGNAETGKEIFQQIVNSLPDSDRQNFRFYTHDKTENKGLSCPLKGIISKIYPNYAIQITNKEGLQILIDIQVDKKNPMPLDKVLQCEVKEGQEVSPKTVLFIVYLEEQVISVSVYIP
ncbi:25443_t:CDS:2 [Gigaspora margarita]|uniref:25443_t:CDS:1 n=1 Tax=Gigaspora margarita TaxID=4874 RepID=A0ABN7URS0_GIGMA|nr:25443_t:CDS:2 [Gigaspora margarita]